MKTIRGMHRSPHSAQEIPMDYAIHTDVKYAPLELVDAGRLADACADPWWNQSLSRVNDCVVRLGVFHGDFRPGGP